MTELKFPEQAAILKFHAKLIERYGGSHGLRDEAALESALAAAQNRHFYEEADLAVCAATYTYHVSQAHAFIDGNKRIAAAAALLFLEMNGVILTLPEHESEEMCLRIAAGEITREEVERLFAAWIAQAG